MATPRIVTTSWDDGDARDLRLAEMLRSRGIAGTFYIPIQPYRSPALTHSELRALSAEGFEIGAHSVSHKHLWQLSAQELAEEINPCKPILEDIIGTEVRMFCYPRGRYDAAAMRMVKQAGYWGARTVRLLTTRSEFNPFEMPTTVEAVENPRLSYFKNAARARSIESLEACLAQMTRLGNWVELGKKLFDSVLEQGGVWHLWGHSWMIDESNQWKNLEEMLDYVSNRDGITYVPNWKLIPASPARAAEPSKTYQENWSL
jgi:peptidoglycan-N-acetylglucosamine deacetylase